MRVNEGLELRTEDKWKNEERKWMTIEERQKKEKRKGGSEQEANRMLRGKECDLD